MAINDALNVNLDQKGEPSRPQNHDLVVGCLIHRTFRILFDFPVIALSFVWYHM